ICSESCTIILSAVSMIQIFSGVKRARQENGKSRKTSFGTALKEITHAKTQRRKEKKKKRRNRGYPFPLSIFFLFAA
ncbi:MAG: hypothetical protein J2P31_13765, partial [Blastocatellia bacterium]|nr:hypothetical protein [Blastocatellia bacterium]